jgi:hypothetical protein
MYDIPVLNFAICDQEESFDLVKRLIDEGAEINVKSDTDSLAANTGGPIHSAVNSGNLKVAGLLIDHGADLNASCRHGTSIHMNMLFDHSYHEEMVKFLIENGAKPQEYSFGNNDLHLAAIKGYADLLQAMVQHGADVNVKNDYGHTPLYYATVHGHRTTADALIAVGANENAIVETNYGKATQLTKTLKDGEAYLWYLGGIAPATGYAVKTKHNLLIFDPYIIDESLDAGLANGKLNPEELADQEITILFTREEPHSFNPTVSELAQRLPVANLVIGVRPTAENGESGDIPAYHLATANQTFSVGNMQIHTIQTHPSTLSSTGNLGYLVEVDGVKVFHAGLHVSKDRSPEIERYRQEIDFLKPFGPIDFVILPIRGRHSGAFDYEPYLYMIDQLSPKAIYLIGDDLVYEEHRKCLQVLSARNVPVEYPDGGIALGERFHYLRD